MPRIPTPVNMLPIMSDLPKERLAYQSPPLTNTGVDYFGPFYVTVRRTTEKMWGFTFTFLTIRAVHFEIDTSMDTSFYVMGVERFVSRRGTPEMIWSDIGTNFIGAEKELRECIEKWNVVSIAAELAHKGVKWRFNPTSAPHQGDIREWLVRSPRCYYPTARIEELRYGSDSVARSAVLRTSNGSLSCKTYTSLPNICFRAGECYESNKRTNFSQSESTISDL